MGTLVVEAEGNCGTPCAVQGVILIARCVVEGRGLVVVEQWMRPIPRRAAGAVRTGYEKLIGTGVEVNITVAGSVSAWTKEERSEL